MKSTRTQVNTAFTQGVIEDAAQAQEIARSVAQGIHKSLEQNAIAIKATVNLQMLLGQKAGVAADPKVAKALDAGAQKIYEALNAQKQALRAGEQALSQPTSPRPNR